MRSEMRRCLRYLELEPGNTPNPGEIFSKMCELAAKYGGFYALICLSARSQCDNYVEDLREARQDLKKWRKTNPRNIYIGRAVKTLERKIGLALRFLNEE